MVEAIIFAIAAALSAATGQVGLEAQPGDFASPTNERQTVRLIVTTSRVNGAGTIHA